MAGYTAKNADWQQPLELMAESSAPHWSGAERQPSLFYCWLDQQPDHLVPGRLLSNATPGDDLTTGRWFMNPCARFTRGGTPFPAGHPETRFLEGFALQAEMAW